MLVGEVGEGDERAKVFTGGREWGRGAGGSRVLRMKNRQF